MNRGANGWLHGKLLLTTGFESRRSLVESSLHIHYAELPVLAFAMRGHRPKKANWVAGNRNVWMVTAGHQHSVAIPHHGDQFRVVRMVIHQLNAERGRGHVEIDIHLFEHLGMLVRWPTRPVAWLGNSEPCDQPSRFDVFGQQHVQFTR